MSSSGSNDSPNKSGVYFLVPLTVVIVLGLLAFWIQRRRTLRRGPRRLRHIYARDRRVLEKEISRKRGSEARTEGRGAARRARSKSMCKGLPGELPEGGCGRQIDGPG